MTTAKLILRNHWIYSYLRFGPLSIIIPTVNNDNFGISYVLSDVTLEKYFKTNKEEEEINLPEVGEKLNVEFVTRFCGTNKFSDRVVVRWDINTKGIILYWNDEKNNLKFIHDDDNKNGNFNVINYVDNNDNDDNHSDDYNDGDDDNDDDYRYYDDDDEKYDFDCPKKKNNNNLNQKTQKIVRHFKRRKKLRSLSSISTPPPPISTSSSPFKKRKRNLDKEVNSLIENILKYDKKIQNSNNLNLSERRCKMSSHYY